MTRVAILLSCFRGSQWILQQLNSIIEPPGFQVTVFVRDDDELSLTQNLVRERYFGKLKIEYVNSGQNKGASQSFFELLRNADGYDFYLFCDQDDEWLHDKIRLQTSLILSFSESSPCACFSDSLVVMREDNIAVGSYFDVVSLPRGCLDAFDYLYINNVTGNSLCINRKMRSLVLELGIPTSAIMHDWWIAIVASFVGKLLYIDKPLLNYYQHASNAVGASSLWRRMVARLFGFDGTLANVDQRLAQAREFRRRVGDRLDDATRRRLDVLLAAPLPVQRLRLIWIRVKMLWLSKVSRLHARFD